MLSLSLWEKNGHLTFMIAVEVVTLCIYSLIKNLSLYFASFRFLFQWFTKVHAHSFTLFAKRNLQAPILFLVDTLHGLAIFHGGSPSFSDKYVDMLYFFCFYYSWVAKEISNKKTSKIEGYKKKKKN